MKAFLGRVFSRAFAQDSGLEERLVTAITNLTIDPKVFTVLLAYYAGTPARQVDHKHSGTVNLAEIIAGKRVTDAAAEEGDDDPEDES